MISRDMFYAIILGLPEKFLEHLKGPWFLIARLVRLAREQKNADPVTALRYAVLRLGPSGRDMLRIKCILSWQLTAARIDYRD